MAKYAIHIIETVVHEHRMIIDSDNKNVAENIADKLFEKANEASFNAYDDVIAEAKKITKVIELDEDYSVYTEDVTIGEGEVYEIEL